VETPAGKSAFFAAAEVKSVDVFGSKGPEPDSKSFWKKTLVAGHKPHVLGDSVHQSKLALF
jgi:hypothetical protein